MHENQEAPCWKPVVSHAALMGNVSLHLRICRCALRGGIPDTQLWVYPH